MLQCVAVCCREGQLAETSAFVLQCVAVCCSMLQRVAEKDKYLRRLHACCSLLQCVAVCCSVFSVLRCVAVSPIANVLQFVAIHLLT